MADSDSIRTCTSCKKPFPATLEFFVKQKSGKFGLTATCKSCRIEKSKQWNALNKDKIRAADRARYAKNPQAKLASSAKWKSANPEKAKAAVQRWVAENRQHYDKRRKEYRLLNKAKIKSAYAAWYANNRDSEIANAAARRAENPDKDRANARAWYYANHAQGRLSRNLWVAANPDKKRAYSENRRARKLGSGSQLSSGIVKRLFSEQGGLCACCGKPLTAYHLDHIVPLAIGGEHKDSNMQLLLPRCNMMKGAKHPDEYKKYRKSLKT